MKSRAQIRNYTDYRAFLNAFAKQMKDQNPNWSLGAWSRQLKLTSRSSLHRVLQGERELGPKIAEKLIHYFNFDPNEADYFRLLILLHKESASSPSTRLFLESLQAQDPVSRLTIRAESLGHAQDFVRELSKIFLAVIAEQRGAQLFELRLQLHPLPKREVA